MPRSKPTFAQELKDLIEAWRAKPGVALQDLVEALDEETEKLVEEVNERAT